MKSCRFKILVIFGVTLISLSCSKDEKEVKLELKPDLQIGAYYFDGWAGENDLANDRQDISGG